MKIKLSVDFTNDEKNLISPFWSSGVWNPSCDIEIYNEIETDRLDNNIVGTPKRHIFVDIADLIEVYDADTIMWHMCSQLSEHINMLVSVGKYDTFEEVLRAL